MRRAWRAALTWLFCGSLASAAGGPTLVIVDARIWTGDQKRPEVEAVAIAGDRIMAVGSTAEIERLKTPETSEMSLNGLRIVPGFNDAHVHLLAGGLNLAGPQLRLSKSAEEFRTTLGVYTRQQPSGRWITGGNWDHENWSPNALPTRQLIDDVTGDHPVFVKRLDGHMALANSLALQLAGVTKKTKDVPGGVIVRDAQGEPTGILKDAAMRLVGQVIPPLSAPQMEAAIRAAQTYANANGVTSVQDMSLTPELARVYQKMAREGELRLRISGHQPLSEWRRLAEAGVEAGFGSDMFRMGALKGFADGSLGSTTALLFAPYLDAPSTSGIPSDELSNPERMFGNMLEADKAGLQIAVHAIGDRANWTVLNFYGQLAKFNGVRDRRPRIEHAQHLQPADIARFGQLGVIASMQPIHLADDGRWAEKRIGAERARTAYAFRSLLEGGAHLAFGSDWDVAPMVPLAGIAAAVTRQTNDGKHPEGWTPSEKISVAEAVKAFTYGSAYASFSEREKGTVAPGMLADLTVLSEDIFAIDVNKIRNVKVAATILGGKVIMGPEDRIFYKMLPSGLLLRP